MEVIESWGGEGRKARPRVLYLAEGSPSFRIDPSREKPTKFPTIPLASKSFHEKPALCNDRGEEEITRPPNFREEVGEFDTFRPRTRCVSERNGTKGLLSANEISLLFSKGLRF